MKFSILAKNIISKLNPDQRALLQQHVQSHGVKTGIGFVLWCIGCHYLYYRKIAIQLLFWVTGGGFLVWWVIDLFRLSGMTEDYNSRLAIDTARDLST